MEPHRTVGEQQCHPPLGMPPGYNVALGEAINGAGHLAVTAVLPDGTYQAFFNDGAWHACGSLPGSGTAQLNAYGLSGADQVVGSQADSAGNRAFLWSASTGIVDLNIYAPGGWTLQQASAANETGRIVGYGVMGGQTRGFMLTPLTPCGADFNSDGGVTPQDLFDFLAAFFAGDPRADWNHDNQFTSQDVFDLVGAFFAGCS